MPPIHRKYRKSYRPLPLWFLYAAMAFVVFVTFVIVAVTGVY